MHTDVDSLADVLSKVPCFDVLASLSRGCGGYVVGGAVRDALTGRPVTDIDLVFPENPTQIAKAFARAISGSWFWLDEKRLQSRVVAAGDQAVPDYDFAPFRAPTLGQDLLDRDFTINSIAVAIDGLDGDAVLIDPLCGVDDLEADILRVASANSFANDPLRILKGIRHATGLGVTIEPKTLDLMQKGVSELYRISPERIRQEAWKIFASEGLAEGLHVMSQTMVGNYLFGNEYPSFVASLCRTLDKYRSRFEWLLGETEIISGWLAEEIEQGLSRKTLLLWTLLLRELDQELPIKLAEEWLLSRKSKSAVLSLCELNEGHVDKFASLPRKPRAYAWWSGFLNVDAKLLLVALVLLSEDDSLQTDSFILEWAQIVDSLNPEELYDLVDGRWLKTQLGLGEGPEMARAQRLVRHAEISGEVDDEAGAQELLRQYYANMD